MDSGEITVPSSNYIEFTDNAHLIGNNTNIYFDTDDLIFKYNDGMNMSISDLDVNCDVSWFRYCKIEKEGYINADRIMIDNVSFRRVRLDMDVSNLSVKNSYFYGRNVLMIYPQGNNISGVIKNNVIVSNGTSVVFGGWGNISILVSNNSLETGTYVDLAELVVANPDSRVIFEDNFIDEKIIISRMNEINYYDSNINASIIEVDNVDGEGVF